MITANVATPVFPRQQGVLYVGYGVGGALLGLTAQDGEVKAQQIYFTATCRTITVASFS